MKKAIIFLIVSALFLGGCGMSNEETSRESLPEESKIQSEAESFAEESSKEESVCLSEEESSAEESLIEEISEEAYEEKSEEPTTEPFITVKQYEFTVGDMIAVAYGNTDAKDWIGLYEPGGEPGGVNSLKWQYSVGKGQITFSTKGLAAGEYGIYLCDNDGYIVLDSIQITIKSDDSNDYGVSGADAVFKKGNSSITVYPSSATDKDGNSLTYVIYWAKDGKRLEGYEPLYTYTSKTDEKFTYQLNANLFMPSSADEIEIAVKEGKSKSLFVTCNDELKLEKSKLLYEFQVLTDIHITSAKPMHSSHLREALRDIIKLSPNSKGIVTVGDNTNEGKDEQYELLTSILAEFEGKLPEIHFALGNHDLVYDTNYEGQVAKFKKYLGMPGAYYSFTVEGSKYIVLGSDSAVGEGTIGATEMNWLKKELESADKTKPIYVFAHQPLVETVSGSLYSMNPKIQYWYGFRSSAAELKTIFESYPNLILFTGHTHWTFDSIQPILVTESGMTYVNCSSVGYLWNDDDKSEPGSEGYFVEVYEDYILLKGREFVNDTWCASAMYCIDIK